MYYELEVFTQGISENTMKILDVKSQGLWGKAKSAIKSIWGDSECNYSIRLGKEIITQASVAENKDGISMSVKGHLYKPDQTYENVALLAEWFQDQEDFNVIDKVRYEQREALEKDRNTIGNEKAIKTHSLSGVIEPGVAAAANAAQAAQSGQAGQAGQAGQPAGSGGNQPGTDADAERAYRKVVLRVLNDDGFVFRVYLFGKAILTSYAETYDMAAGTGTFEMVLTETAKVSVDAAQPEKNVLVKAARGIKKVQRYTDGAATAAKTVGAVVGTVGAAVLVAKGGKKDKVTKGIERWTKGTDAAGDLVQNLGGVGNTLTGLGIGDSAKDNAAAFNKAKEKFTDSAKTMKTAVESEYDQRKEAASQSAEGEKKEAAGQSAEGKKK